MTVVPFDADAHRALQMLLPWYATNSLDQDEAARVEAHLADCPACRAELDLERRLQAAQALATDSGDVERGLRTMRARIRSEPPHAPGARPDWWRWALGAQFAVIAALAGALLLQRTGTETYRALGAPSPAVSANVLVMFKPDATEQQIRNALRISGARLVDGPTASNAYLLHVPEDGHIAAIAGLRVQPGVAIAESLAARPAR